LLKFWGGSQFCAEVERLKTVAKMKETIKNIYKKSFVIKKFNAVT